MTSSRQVVHIVSSARYERDMVLSLAGRLPPRGQFTPLMVEKKRESRENKQTWRFTEVSFSFIFFFLHFKFNAILPIHAVIYRMGGCCWIQRNICVLRAPQSFPSEKVI